METYSWIVNMFGIVISLWGTIQIFRGTPRDTTGTEGEIKPIERIMYEEALTKELVKRNKRSKWGLGLLAVGFILQVVAQSLVHPF